MREPLLWRGPDRGGLAREHHCSRWVVASLAYVPARLEAFFLGAVCGLRCWWQATTDPEYLQSGISRRPSLKISLLCIATSTVAFDAVLSMSSEGHWWWVLPDLPAAVATLGYSLSSIRSNSLWLDVIVTAWLTVTIAMWGASFVYDDADPQILAYHEAINAGSLVWFPGIMVAVAFAGLHSLACVWLLVLLLAWLSASPSDVPWQTLFISLSIAVASVYLEFTLAVLYREWQTQLRCNQKLLEGATDGFGVVDCVTGLVLEASPKMLETLASASLVGQSLQCGLDDSQHASLADFFGTADPALEPVPVLVTWSMNNFECEVRLLPYELQGSKMGFSVHRVGEVRSPTAPAPQARAATGAVRERHKRAGRGRPGGRIWSSRLGRGSGSATEQADSPAPSTSPTSSGEYRGNYDNFEKLSRCACCKASRRLTWALDRKSHSSRSRSTVSLSSLSWSVSNGDATAELQTQGGKKRIMRTIATQTFASRRSKPPAPLLASSFPPSAQAKATRNAKLARRLAAVVIQEGLPRMTGFRATPQATRLHSLQTVARSCNITGSGCCCKHIAWMGLQSLISDVMLSPCEDFRCFSGWQCPDCLAVHDYEDGSNVDEEEQHDDQFCIFCMDTVTPVLPSGCEQQLEPSASTAAANLLGETAFQSDTLEDLNGRSSGSDSDFQEMPSTLAVV